MSIIALYAPDATDFSTLGLGTLTPIECTVEEQAGEMYELTLVQPIDNTLRWAQLKDGCIISAPVPVRESPQYSEASPEPAPNAPSTVTRDVYRVTGTSVGVRLRTGPGTGYRRLSTHKDGTLVVKLDVPNSRWMHVCLVDGGATGYMSTKYLTLDHQQSEPANPSTSSPTLIRPAQSRTQLFRIYSVETDSDAGTVTAHALHVFYDLRGNLIDAEYAPKEAAASEVVENIASKLLNPHPFTVHAEDLIGKVNGDYSYKSPVEALLDPDEGVAVQAKARVVRDNFDLWLLPDEERDRGVTVRRGKNLVGVTVTSDNSNVVTRIVPVGKNKTGEPLYITDGTGPDGRCVDSPRIGEYPNIMAQRIEYDVSVGTPGDDNKDKVFKTDALARAELRRLAEAEYSENGVDLPSYGMEVDFLLIKDAAGYEHYASLQAVYLYDTVTVIDSLIGLTAKVRVTGYSWNALTEQYESVTLGELQSLKQTVYSYNLPTGGVSGSKIAPGTASGNILRDATIQYAKISVAAIEQLNAGSITALTAHLQEIIAGSVTADELYAALATINKAVIGSAEIDWASIDRLTAVIAQLSQAEIGTADIDWAHIKDLATDTAIITEGVGGRLMISRLAVTEANMVSLTTGELVVKGEDGGFYAVSVDEEGRIVTTRKQVANDDVQNLSINAGEKIIEGTVTAACLNARDIFADSAVIRELIAANLDVDKLFAREAFVNLLRTSRIVGGKSIEILAGEVSGAQASADAAQGAIDNLRIGGRNLLRNSNRFTADSPLTVSSAGTDEALGGNGLGVYAPITPGETYMFQAVTDGVWGGHITDGTGGGVTHFYAYLRTQADVNSGSLNTFSLPVLLDRHRQVADVNTGRAVWKLTVPTDAEYVQLSLRIDIHSDGYTPYTYNYWDLKLEKGNRVTDWTPAPEDVDASIQQAAEARVHTGSNPPPTPIPAGKIWVDTGETPNVIRRWLGLNAAPDRDYGGSATGNPVETPAGTISFDGLTSAFLPVQAGSGTPSPENLRPISGRTAATLTQNDRVYTAAFGQTIYGGTMDWRTGVLTVERGSVQFMPESLTAYGTAGFYRALMTGVSPNAVEVDYHSICNRFRRSYAYNANDEYCYVSGTAAFVFSNRWTTLADARAWFSKNPTTMVYKLAQPYAIQLALPEIEPVSGVNTLSTSGGSVTVRYTASGWETVNDLTDINRVSNQLIAQQAAAQRELDRLGTAITVDTEGAHFYKPGYRTQNEVRIDQDSVDILVGGKTYSSFVPNGLVLGNYMLWQPEEAGGLAFNLR